MIKFESADLKLEVIRCAGYTQGYLNRQVITLLSCNGVDDDLFLDRLARAKEMTDTRRICNNL